MKIRNVSMLAAAAAAVGLASAASGLTLTDLIGNYYGPIVIKLQGYNEGTIYTGLTDGVEYSGQATLDGLSQIRPKNPVPADNGGQYEDSWSVFRVTEIADNFSQKLWGDLDLMSDGHRYQITGMVWGENDVYVKQTAVTGGSSQLIRGTNVKFAFWLEKDPTNSTRFFGSGAGTLDPFSRDDNDPYKYPTINEGTLIWTGNSTELFAGAGYDYETTVIVNGASVVGGSGGKMAGNLGPNAAGIGAWNSALDLPTSPDLIARFTIDNTNPTRGFDAFINDPIYGTSVPTPSAIGGGMILAGLVGLNIYRRRRAS